MQDIPVFLYVCGDKTIRFAPDSPYWITSISGADGLDIALHETQSIGQSGATRIGASISSRDVTVTGAILSDLDDAEYRLKQTIRPGASARLYKTVRGVEWYLEGEPKRTVDVNDAVGLLPFQFKFHAYYPFWRTSQTRISLLGGVESTWFPAPVHTGGRFWISKYKQSLFTSIINEGNMETEFRVAMRASARVVNPMIYHLGTDTYIRLNRELLTGERAEISTVTGQRGCTIYHADGTTENGYRYLDIESDLAMKLSPGENILRLTAETGRENLVCRLHAPRGVMSGV